MANQIKLLSLISPCSSVTHCATEDAQTQTKHTHVPKIESCLEQPIHSNKVKELDINNRYLVITEFTLF